MKICEYVSGGIQQVRIIGCVTKVLHSLDMGKIMSFIKYK